MVYSKLNDASIKYGLFTTSSNSNSILFTAGIPIFAYHSHSQPGNSDSTIEYAEIYEHDNGLYNISMYYFDSSYNLNIYYGAAMIVFYI